MRHSRLDWLQRIRLVEREHAAARLAADHLLAAARRDSAILTGKLKLRDVRLMAERLEATYLIRLFAEFETGLRLAWRGLRRTDPPSRTKDLLDGMAATRRVPHDRLDEAHVVREYRNTLVHEREESAEPVPLAQARTHLCQFLSFLPPTW